MKVKHLFFHKVCFVFLSAIFFMACEKTEEKKSYPYVFEYQELAFGPSRWFVLTSDATNQIAQPPTMVGFDDSLRTILLSENSLPPFRRLEFLSDSTVVVGFTDGNMTFDTIMPYEIYQGYTKIKLGQSPEETLVFYNLSESNGLVLGVISTIYSYKQTNGAVDYSPLGIRYSQELNVSSIINDLRNSHNLMPNDTVAVNKAGYVFK